MTQNSQQEIVMDYDDFIVSKTNVKGKITYCNRIFIKIAGYNEKDLLGQPHNIIRHPDMPRSVFRLLWNTLQEGNEFFGLVKNKTRSGGFYWAFANVTASVDKDGTLLGYYSVRRKPERTLIDALQPIYQQMLEEEARHSNAKEAMDASSKILMDFIQLSGKSYDEFLITFEK